jgi:RNA binding exosome subunit
MAIKIDVTHISDDLKSVIQNAIKQKSFSGSQDNDYAGNCIKIVLSNDNDRQKVKQLLEDILRKNQINDYIVVDNIKEEDEIAILRKDDLEQLGIFFCPHCGMLFSNEGECIIHQRIHYFI